jgi:hypothetical protein
VWSVDGRRLIPPHPLFMEETVYLNPKTQNMKARTILTTLALSALCARGVSAVTIADIPEQCVLKNGTPEPITFTVTGALDLRVLLVTSGNPSLIPPSSLSSTVMGQTVTLTFEIAADQTGETELELVILASPALLQAHVLVRIVEPLQIICPGPIKAYAEAGSCGAIVNFSPGVEGGCGAASVICVPESGSSFGLGTTVVMCTAESGTSTDGCRFDVTVTSSGAASSTLICPADIVLPLPFGAAELIVNYPAISASSGCGIVSQGCVPVSGSAFGPGTTPVQCHALDGAGHLAECSFLITVEPSNPGNKCPMGKGSWKNRDQWPANQLEIGERDYSHQELRALLSLPVRRDASVILASQLIPALLNVANGSNPEPIRSLLADASEWLSGLEGKLPFYIVPSSTLGQQMTAAAKVLEQFNQGLFTSDCTQ